jgi:hypothetical protein
MEVPVSPSRTVVLVAASSILGGVVACSPTRHAPADPAPLAASVAAERARVGMPVPDAVARAGADADRAKAESVTQGPSASESASAFGRPQLVRTAQLALEVDDADVASRSVESIADEDGGYVAGMSASRDGRNRRSAVVTVRVRPDSFMRALTQLRSLGDELSSSIETEDVGQQSADLEARIRTKRDALERMRAILADRTGTLAEVTSVEAQLGTMIAELDQLEGQRRWYASRVDLSTITVTLREPGTDVVVDVPRVAWLDPFRRSVHSGLETLSVLGAGATYFAIVLAPWLALAAIAWALVRRVQRAKRTA